MIPINNFKKPILLIPLMLLKMIIFGQNVGIGVPNPTKELSVKGSIIVDNDYENEGEFNQAGLRFGEMGTTHITATKNPAGVNFNGIDFWTNSKRRVSISSSGNVGVGVADPFYKLDVAGSLKVTGEAFFDNSIAIDGHVAIGSNIWSLTNRFVVNNGDSYFDGDATIAGLGVFNNKLYVGGQTPTSEKFYVNGTTRLNGIVTVESNLFNNGNIYTTGNATIDGNARSFRMSVGGAIDNDYKLRVYDGNARIGGDFHASGNAAIGGLVDDSYKLRVYNGNSRFGGDAQVTGNLDAGSLETGTITATSINGKGIVKSNGNSSLRVGFDQVSINTIVNNLSKVDVTANISEFTGNNNDVRVSISQFVADPLPQYSDWSFLTFTIHSIDSATNTCKVRVSNPIGFPLQIKGTFYLMSVVKD